MSPIVVFIFFCHLTSTNAVMYVNSRHLLAVAPNPPQQHPQDPDANEAKNNDVPVEINVDSRQKDVPSKATIDEAAPKSKKTKSTSEAPAKNETKQDEHKVFKTTTEMESGALLRGVTVIVILTTLVIIYMALKTYCGKKGKHPTMVSKYGVRTRRSDIEMTPLPLEEDEDDETLFDVNTTNR